MNLLNLKQRLSPRNISESFMSVVMRFPVAVMFLTTLTALLSYIVITDISPGRVMQCILCFLCAGTLISLATSLWGEEQSDKRQRWVAEGISLALCGVYCALLFLTDIIPNRGLPSFYIGNIAWIIAIVLLIPFCSFFGEKDDLKVWHFLISLCKSLLISGVVAWLMTGGLEGLLLGTAALFDFQPDNTLALVIMIVCNVLLGGILFLALLPQGERKHNHSEQMPSLLTKIVSWLLLPLLSCYIVVLYFYGINILIHWELPKGMLSWLVAAVMAAYILCYILLYPQVRNKQTWQSNVLTFWLPIVILPLLLLMTVGVVRRFIDYGATAPRLYLLTLLLWFYAICVVMLVVRRKRFRWIALSFATLLVVSSGQPLNYYRICRHILTAKIDRKINIETLTEEEQVALKEDISYMQTNYGKEYASRWQLEDTASQYQSSHETIWEIEYYNGSRSYISPQGYAKFEWTCNTLQLSEDSIYNGILHLACRDAVLLLDTANIRRAQQDINPLLIMSSDNNTAFTPEDISITAHKDHTIDVNYSGYIFTKE